MIYIGPRRTTIQHVIVHNHYPEKHVSYGVSVNRNGVLRHAGHRYFHIALLKAWWKTYASEK